MGFTSSKLLGILAGMVPLAFGGYLFYRAMAPEMPAENAAESGVTTGAVKLMPEEQLPPPEPPSVPGPAFAASPEEAGGSEVVELPAENAGTPEEGSFVSEEEFAAMIAARFGSDGFAGKVLAAGGIARRIVQAADAVANGERPVTPLEFMLPRSPFSTRRNSRGNSVISDRATARWQSAVNFFCMIPAEEMVKLYQRSEMLLQQECDNIGYRGTPVRNIFLQALDAILAVPVPGENPELISTGAPGSYRYADRNLEALNDAQKLFLRLGVDNCRRLQEHCREIAAGLRRQ
ncbi:MAG: DUF3014 domain-containing protein [Victivallales bacterium]|nr:DUF3014 domain-containing protein [Victivallales bacterium]